MSDVFERGKVTADCLSAWRVSQLALGLLPQALGDEARAHLGCCADCARRVAIEEQAMRVAAYERVPDAIFEAAAARQRHTRRPWIVGALAAASAAAVLLFVLPDGQNLAVRTKGAPAVSVTVLRGDTLVLTQEPLERVQGLHPGDRLRLHVDAPEPWVVLQGFERRAWITYFHGRVPTDHWLPVGVTTTPEGETRLRVLVCMDEPPVGTLDSLVAKGVCRERVFDL